MVPGSKKRLITMLLLMVIVFSIGNLIFNVERLDMGDEIILDNPEAEGGGSYIASSSTMAETVRYMMIGFMAIGIIITIGGIVYGTATKDKEFMKSIMYPLIGGGLAILLIVGTFAYLEIEKSEYTQNELLEEGYTSSNSTGGSGNYTEPSNVKPDGMDMAVSVMLAIGAVAGIAIAIFAISQITQLRTESLSGIDMEAMTEEVGQTIQKAMDDMTSGTDVRSSIMRCYSDMCKLASKHGISDEEHLTPREFESMVGSRLPIEDEKLHDLILIFEEARYSDHDLSEEMRNKAIIALGSIKDDLVIEEEIDIETVDEIEKVDDKKVEKDKNKKIETEKNKRIEGEKDKEKENDDDHDTPSVVMIQVGDDNGK